MEHVYEGRRHPERLEVAFLTEVNGKPFLLDDGYLWVKPMHTTAWIGTLLQGVQHTKERIRIRVEQSRHGSKILSAEKVETPATVLEFPTEVR